MPRPQVAGLREGLRQHSRKKIDHRPHRQGPYLQRNLEWVWTNPAWSEYLFENRRTKFVAAIELQIKQLNQITFRQWGALLDKYQRRGEIMRLPLVVTVSILIGPAQQFARMLLGRRSRIEVTAAIAPLADAARRSIRISSED
jgi:hypothetical protein